MRRAHGCEVPNETHGCEVPDETHGCEVPNQRTVKRAAGPDEGYTGNNGMCEEGTAHLVHEGYTGNNGMCEEGTAHLVHEGYTGSNGMCEEGTAHLVQCRGVEGVVWRVPRALVLESICDSTQSRP